QAHRMAQERAATEVAAPAGDAQPPPISIPPVAPDQPPSQEDWSDQKVRRDPLGAIAEAAGYDDGERWWEHMVETRSDEQGLFDAILEMMAALRERSPVAEDPEDLLRE